MVLACPMRLQFRENGRALSSRISLPDDTATPQRAQLTEPSRPAPRGLFIHLHRAGIIRLLEV
uniref:Uncharacterized protein n=1 Tax=Bionectria ochroleuca TaxID=29856 RepID=A0A0B7JR82_BIOOC